MKKLDLKFGSIKEMLTKEQMKMISGGMGCDVTGVGSQDLGFVNCSGDACACQDYMDGQCSLLDGCDDIDCGCK